MGGEAVIPVVGLGRSLKLTPTDLAELPLPVLDEAEDSRDAIVSLGDEMGLKAGPLRPEVGEGVELVDPA